jgi:DNA-binding GntR family transcriptional regulator
MDANDGLRTRESFVADALRSAILRGIYKPGDKLDQQQLADELRVSRSPVREALRILGAEGLVTIVPNRGAVVAERTLDELEELYFLRVVLEGAAAERAAKHMTQQRENELAAILMQAERTDDYEELLELNNEFHMLIYTAYPQPIMISYIQQLRNQFGPYNRLYLDRRAANSCLERHRGYDMCARNSDLPAETKTLEQVFGGLQRNKGVLSGNHFQL